MLFASGALSKDILNNRGTISIRARDIFNTQQRELTTRSDTFSQYTTLRREIPSITASFTYRVRQKKVQNKQRQREAREDVGF